MKKLFFIVTGLIFLSGIEFGTPAMVKARQATVCLSFRNFAVRSFNNVIKFPSIKSNDPDNSDVEISEKRVSKNFVQFTGIKLKVKYRVCLLATFFSPLIFDLPPPQNII